MSKKILAGSVAAGLALMSQSALAQPFNTFDPVSMSMGGVGVALPMPTTANLYNPSLLSSFKAERDEDFAVGFSLGARAYDPDKMRDVLKDVEDDFNGLDELVYQLNSRIDQVRNDLENIQPADFINDFTSIRDQLVDQARELDNSLNKVNGNSAQVELGTALLMNLPRERWAIGLTASAQATVGAKVHYNDSRTLNDLINQVDALDPENPGSLGRIDFDSDENLKSSAELLGAAIGEFGLTFAKRVELFGQDVSLGVTPKYMLVETIYHKADIKDIDVDDISDHRSSYSDFNLDIGLLKEFNNGLYTGLVGKNLISRDYETAQDQYGQSHTIALRPQLRAGLGYDGIWYRVGMDVDLTKNKPLAFEDASRYVAVGGELSAWGWAHLRAGYRFDTQNNDRSVASLGLGIAPFKVLHFDLAVAGNSNEIGVSTQLALTF